MLKRNQRLFFVFAALALMLACAPALPGTTVETIPTFDPNSINTLIAQTAEAAATQTALLAPPTYTPTLTPIPTQTASNTPEPTATFIFLLDTPTPTKVTVSGSGSYSCELISQTPKDNSVFPPGTEFEMRWTVKNIGSAIWDSSSMDFIYVSGTKMGLKNAYDLERTVVSNNAIDLVVDMKSPAETGRYTTAWALKDKKQQFCKLTLIIEVK